MKTRSPRPERPEDGPEGRPVRVRAVTGGGLAAAVLAVVGLAVALEPPGGPPEPPQGRFRRQPAPVMAVTFAPDGRTLALGRGDGATTVRDLAGGGSRDVPLDAPDADAADGPGPGRAPVYSVAFSPDGRSLASAGPGPLVRVRDARTGRPRAELAGHAAPARSVAYSPDGRALASGSIDGQLRLRDPETGRDLAPLAGHSGEVRALAFAPDGRTLASGSFDGTVKLWDLPDGHLRSTLRPGGGDRRVYGLAFAPDGKLLALSLGASVRGEPGGLILWDLAGAREEVRMLGNASFAALAFSPDGRTLASGGGDRVVKLWDVRTGQERATLVGHEGFIESVAFSPDGHFLATGGQDTLVGLYDLRPDARQAHKL